jgi:hypothetical protein
MTMNYHLCSQTSIPEHSRGNEKTFRKHVMDSVRMLTQFLLTNYYCAVLTYITQQATVYATG